MKERRKLREERRLSSGGPAGSQDRTEIAKLQKKIAAQSAVIRRLNGDAEEGVDGGEQAPKGRGRGPGRK